MKGMAAELAAIKPEAFAAEPEWVTWQFLDHAFKQDAATTVCRNELWTVSPIGWQAALSQIASVQPVDTDEARAQALSRWRDFGPWFDREIANLKEGQRLGYSATEAAAQLDAEPARPDARAEAGRVAPDGSGDPRQDARVRRRVEAGHRGNRVAGDHALSRFPPGRVSRPCPQVRVARGHAGRAPVLSRTRFRDDDRGCRSGRALRRRAEGSGTRARHRGRPRAQAVRREGDRLEIAGRRHPRRPAREIRVRRRDPRLHAAHLRAGPGRGRQDGADAARRQGRDRAVPGVPAGERAGRPVPAGGR